MSALLILAVYLSGYLPAAALLTRANARLGGTKTYCHRGNSAERQWTRESYCRDSCDAGCWRSDGPMPPDFWNAGIGSAMALLWPVIAIPAIVLLSARIGPKSKAALWSPEQIARMERELGIGGDSA